jgi:V8-like Glu-specific endopeptidase
LIIEDAREYVFPLFSVPAEGNAIRAEKRVFLGTAFLVSKRGDAVTAGHVLPAPDQLGEGHRLVAVIYQGGKQEVCWVTHAAKFEASDVALVHVNLDNTKYLPLVATEVPTGTDVEIIGIPNHEVWLGGKEMRMLKGHVTMSGHALELSCAVPRGMSGAPVFVGGKVAAYATGTIRSEEVDESIEETVEESDLGRVIRRTEVRRVIQYGVARTFIALDGMADPALDGKSLPAYVSGRNAEA